MDVLVVELSKHARAILKEKLAFGFWIDKDDLADLVKATESSAPIYRTDWFSMTVLGMAYYDLFGVKDRQGFFKRIGHDPKKAIGISAGVLFRSNFSLGERHFLRQPLVNGGYLWSAFEASGNGDLPILTKLDSDYHQAAYIASLDNGLQAYFVSDKKGSRMAHMDVRITIDQTAAGTDVRARCAISCVACHVDGVQEFKDDVRTLLAKNLEIRVRTREEAKAIAGRFKRDLPFARDQKHYATAVKDATGLTPAELSKLIAKCRKDFYATVTLATAARELFVTEKELATALKASEDIRLVSMLVGLAIRREAWDAAYPQAQELLMRAARR